MASAFAGTLHFRVRASRWHRVLVVLTHGLALLVGAVLCLHRPALAGVLPLVLGSGVFEYRRATLRFRRSIHRIRWQEDGTWRWQTRDGRWQVGHRTGEFVAGTFLVVVTLKAGRWRWRRQSCVLFRDSLENDAHRQLRARLTVMPVTSAESGDA